MDESQNLGLTRRWRLKSYAKADERHSTLEDSGADASGIARSVVAVNCCREGQRAEDQPTKLEGVSLVYVKKAALGCAKGSSDSGSRAEDADNHRHRQARNASRRCVFPNLNSRRRR